MTLRWIAAASLSGALVTLPALAQSPAPKETVPAASARPAPAGPAPASPQVPGDPNSSYPLAGGGTYQGPLAGQPDPTPSFYKGYNRT